MQSSRIEPYLSLLHFTSLTGDELRHALISVCQGLTLETFKGLEADTFWYTLQRILDVVQNGYMEGTSLKSCVWATHLQAPKRLFLAYMLITYSILSSSNFSHSNLNTMAICSRILSGRSPIKYYGSLCYRKSQWSIACHVIPFWNFYRIFMAGWIHDTKVLQLPCNWVVGNKSSDSVLIPWAAPTNDCKSNIKFSSVEEEASPSPSFPTSSLGCLPNICGKKARINSIQEISPYFMTHGRLIWISKY